MRSLKAVLGVCCGLAVSAPLLVASRPATISFASLIEELVDREAAARWPEPAFTLKQASSYNRRSTTPGTDDWFANQDRSNFIRTDTVPTADGARVEHVMLDALGPGAIVRFWAGGVTDLGTVRIYLDGADEPVLSGTADTLIGGPKYFPEPWAAVRAQGRNLYAPIPYAKRIRVTYDGPLLDTPDELGGKGFFWYNINYRTYPTATRVESFSLASLAAMKERLEAVGRSLMEHERLDYTSTGTLRPKQRFRAACNAGRGPAAIASLHLRLRAPALEAALRQTVLSLTFDGHRTVHVPVGDFFGSGVGLNPFKDRWRHVDREGNLSARWIMPYRERCDVAVTNYGQQIIEYAYADARMPWQWDDRSLYFHADWRQGNAIDAARPTDFNYLTVRGGRGIYMGDVLSVFNPVPVWWGEGDEKIWVDGEAFPSHFGTGTEDYYGYASGTQEVFSAPFHAQPRAGEKTQGHTTNTRVRGLDGIPFRESLKVDMEIWHAQFFSRRPVTVDYAVASFWYGDASSQGNPELNPKRLAVPKARK